MRERERDTISESNNSYCKVKPMRAGEAEKPKMTCCFSGQNAFERVSQHTTREGDEEEKNNNMNLRFTKAVKHRAIEPNTASLKPDNSNVWSIPSLFHPKNPLALLCFPFISSAWESGVGYATLRRQAAPVSLSLPAPLLCSVRSAPSPTDGSLQSLGMPGR